MKTLIAILAITAFQVHAETGDTWLNLHVGSWHVDNDQWYETTSYFSPDNGEYMYSETEWHDFNENNYGLGLTHELIDHLDIRAGVFRNSFNHTSVYTGIGWHTSYDKTFSATLQAGIATGYKNTPTGGDSIITGYVIPTIGIGFDRFRAEIGYIPDMSDTKSSVVTFSFGIRL